MLGRLPLAGAALLSSALCESGFALSEGAAGADWCAAVRRDITALHAGGALQRSLNRVATARADAEGGGAEGHLCEKKGIHELDVVFNGALAAPDALDAAPALRTWLGDSLRGVTPASEAAESSAKRDEPAASADAGEESGCAALMAALNAAAPWLELTHLARASLCGFAAEAHAVG